MSRFDILTARSELIQDRHVVSRFQYLAVKEEKKSAVLVLEDMGLQIARQLRLFAKWMIIKFNLWED